MTFEEAETEYEALRLKLIPILRTVLPTDPATRAYQRQVLEGYYLDVMEAEAELYSHYKRVTTLNYEQPECKSYDYASALAHKEQRVAKRALAAVEALKSRQIKLSQDNKEGRS